MSTMCDHRVPGEHEKDGVVYFEAIPRDTIDKIPDLQLHDDDVILATYPKCGELPWQPNI